MKAASMILFFSIFFLVYGLVNFYIFLRGWQAVPPGSILRIPFVILFLVLALSFFAGRFLERVWYSAVSTTLLWMGSFWLAAMLYYFLFLVALDLCRMANQVLPFVPEAVTADYQGFKLKIALGATGLIAMVLIAGFINARSPRIKELQLTIPKHVEGVDQLTIVAASDIHLGTIVGKGRLRTLVERINAVGPDLVLLPGDIVDEDLGPVIRENLGEMLRGIQARYGVFAVTGNHEYIGGADAACRYLEDHGITVLRDSVARLENGLCIVGREDRSITQFAGKKRKTLEELLAPLDEESVLLVMDHQPFGLDEAARLHVDLQLSGHTHHGQLWPFNFLTSAIYEVSWGYRQKQGTHLYVSSGFGTWGPPVRTGNQPEIVVIHLQFPDRGAGDAL